MKKIELPLGKNQLKEIILRVTDTQGLDDNLIAFKETARETYLVLLDYYFFKMEIDEIKYKFEIKDFFQLCSYKNFLMISCFLGEEFNHFLEIDESVENTRIEIKRRVDKELSSAYSNWKKDLNILQTNSSDFEYKGHYFDYSIRQFTIVSIETL